MPASQVASVERKAGPSEEYAARKAELEALAASGPDAARLAAAERSLGLWCRDRGLRRQAVEHLTAADRRAGGDREAAQALLVLGQVRWHDAWVPKAEAMERLGYVFRDGRKGQAKRRPSERP